MNCSPHSFTLSMLRRAGPSKISSRALSSSSARWPGTPRSSLRWRWRRRVKLPKPRMFSAGIAGGVCGVVGGGLSGVQIGRQTPFHSLWTFPPCPLRSSSAGTGSSCRPGLSRWTSPFMPGGCRWWEERLCPQRRWTKGMRCPIWDRLCAGSTGVNPVDVHLQQLRYCWISDEDWGWRLGMAAAERAENECRNERGTDGFAELSRPMALFDEAT